MKEQSCPKTKRENSVTSSSCPGEEVLQTGSSLFHAVPALGQGTMVTCPEPVCWGSGFAFPFNSSPLNLTLQTVGIETPHLHGCLSACSRQDSSFRGTPGHQGTHTHFSRVLCLSCHSQANNAAEKYKTQQHLKENFSSHILGFPRTVCFHFKIF